MAILSHKVQPLGELILNELLKKARVMPLEEDERLMLRLLVKTHPRGT